MEFPEFGEDSKHVSQLMNEIEAFENRQPASTPASSSAADPFPMDDSSSSSSDDEHSQDQAAGSQESRHRPRRVAISSDEEDILQSRRRRLSVLTQDLGLLDDDGGMSPASWRANEGEADPQIMFLERLQRELPIRVRSRPVTVVDMSEQLNQLEQMGFTRPLATQALRLNRNNLERSIEWLTQQ